MTQSRLVHGNRNPPGCSGISRVIPEILKYMVTVEFYLRNFAELNKVNADPEFQALQASEDPFVNIVHTVVTLSCVEKYVDGGKAVNSGPDCKSLYPQQNDLPTAFPARPVEGDKYTLGTAKDEAK